MAREYYNQPGDEFELSRNRATNMFAYIPNRHVTDGPRFLWTPALFIAHSNAITMALLDVLTNERETFHGLAFGPHVIG